MRMCASSWVVTVKSGAPNRAPTSWLLSGRLESGELASCPGIDARQRSKAVVVASACATLRPGDTIAAVSYVDRTACTATALHLRCPSGGYRPHWRADDRPHGDGHLPQDRHPGGRRLLEVHRAAAPGDGRSRPCRFP